MRSPPIRSSPHPGHFDFYWISSSRNSVRLLRLTRQWFPGSQYPISSFFFPLPWRITRPLLATSTPRPFGFLTKLCTSLHIESPFVSFFLLPGPPNFFSTLTRQLLSLPFLRGHEFKSSHFLYPQATLLLKIPLLLSIISYFSVQFSFICPPTSLLRGSRPL